ncbi:MAG: hypothetical protein RL026_833 [Pseudomonadota bacterium]
MALRDLIVINRRGDATLPASLVLPDDAHSCRVQTCLREVRVAADPSRAWQLAAAAPGAADGVDIYTGAEAYGFLLRLACGLESEIIGETEIFGQIKEAWRQFESAHAEAARGLRPWLQRLLQDTKEIRSEHIVGLGSATYGSLARRLLGGRAEGTILLVGAGQLAATVLPYLDCPDLRLWNRTPERVFKMLAEARERPAHCRTTVLEPTLEAELQAWRQARHVVLCVPADADRDAARLAAWRAGEPRGDGRILHLGILSAAGTVWAGVPGLATLGDLFRLRDVQAGQRDALIARARRACTGKAQLALLDDADGSRPGSSNHGWEDLALFQGI